jgi:hypothetical protein
MKQSAFILARMNGLQVCTGMLEMLSYGKPAKKSVRDRREEFGKDLQAK